MTALLLSLAGSCYGGKVTFGDMAFNADAGRTVRDATADDADTMCGGIADGTIQQDAGKVCSSATDCDDSDPCTVDDCLDGHCNNQPLACDDQDGCTRDMCDAEGQCRHEPACDAEATCVDNHCQCNEGYLGDGFTCSETTCPDGRCSEDEDAATCPQDCDYDLVVVTQQDLATPLAQDLAQYQQDAQTQGKRVILQTWTSGDASQLKGILWAWVDKYDLAGAWLVGDMPAAWYEQTAFNAHEEFPTDVFLESRDATWIDQDHDGRYDRHGELHADTFVSRLIASSQAQYHAYFAKNHAYRTTGPLTRKAAFVFIDDDWVNWAGTYGLGNLYAAIDLLSDTSETTKTAYLDEMTNQGAEFVYQWIHSTPTTLYVRGTGGGTIPASTVSSSNLQGSFYNLYDCSASRFVTHCLAVTYLTETDYGLATVGTTKVGGMYSGTSFHVDLANGKTWGEAFQQWYELHGRYDDEWFLGMVILGDPLLTIDKDPSVPSPPTQPIFPQSGTIQMSRLRRIMEQQARFQPIDTFDDYQADHPEFFGHP